MQETSLLEKMSKERARLKNIRIILTLRNRRLLALHLDTELRSLVNLTETVLEQAPGMQDKWRQ